MGAGRTTFWLMGAAMALALTLGIAGCAETNLTREATIQPARVRAFVDTFDRILVAGFLAGSVSDRGRELDMNDETARLLRMTLRSKASFDVIDAQPLDLRHIEPKDASAEDAVLHDVPFWRRLGQEYREPLIVTGSVRFVRVGSQFDESTIGPRTVRLPRPQFSLQLRLVFISGRTGEILDSVVLGPTTAHASDNRTSALGLYFQMMDRLTPSLLAAFGRDAVNSHSGSRSGAKSRTRFSIGDTK